MTDEPDMTILPAIRNKLSMAEEQLQIACGLFRKKGWPENADELTRTLRHLRTWTQKDGWLDQLEFGSPYMKGME